MSKPSAFVRIPKERVGVLVGPDGKVKQHIEEKLSVKLEVEDSPNSAGVVIDLIRAAKIALDRKTSGALLSMPAYAFKHPPVQVPDPVARQWTEDWIAGLRER